MSMRVIEPLEMVDIRHDDTDRITFAPGSQHFESEHLLQVTPVE